MLIIFRLKFYTLVAKLQSLGLLKISLVDVQCPGETKHLSIDSKTIILSTQCWSRSSSRASSKSGRPKESERHRTKSRTKSRSRSCSPRSRYGSENSLVVHPAQERHESDDKTEAAAAPTWAKGLLEAQERSQLCLEKLKAEIRKSERKRESQDGFRKQKHKFSISIYEEQYDLNMDIYIKLKQATTTEDIEERNTLLKDVHRQQKLTTDDRFFYNLRST